LPNPAEDQAPGEEGEDGGGFLKVTAREKRVAARTRR